MTRQLWTVRGTGRVRARRAGMIHCSGSLAGPVRDVQAGSGGISLDRGLIVLGPHFVVGVVGWPWETGGRPHHSDGKEVAR